jgi:hypothetical protein
VPQLSADPVVALTGLLTLRWLPAYLDILPMYLVILAIVPVMMAAAGVHRLLPLALSAGLYGAVWTTGLNLPGDPWSGAGWFFNPFAWQLVFFTGFSIAMGWLRPPRLRERRWMIAATGFLLLSLPLAFWGIRLAVPGLQAIHDLLLPANEKTDLHWLRYVHFLALAYLALSMLEPYRARLSGSAAMVIVGVGRQSLATFLVSLVAARAAGIVFQWAGTGPAISLAVNLAGIGIVIATAQIVAWFKSSPWQRLRQPAGHRPALLDAPSPA